MILSPPRATAHTHSRRPTATPTSAAAHATQHSHRGSLATRHLVLEVQAFHGLLELLLAHGERQLLRIPCKHTGRQQLKLFGLHSGVLGRTERDVSRRASDYRGLLKSQSSLSMYHQNVHTLLTRSIGSKENIRHEIGTGNAFKTTALSPADSSWLMYSWAFCRRVQLCSELRCRNARC